MTYYLLDVFAPERYQGNQLCVFVDAENLTGAEMLQLAQEINFQETTFITGGSAETGFDVRIFTPEYEVPFAGHPTLGTAYVIANHFLTHTDAVITLNLPVGPIRTQCTEEFYWLEAAHPQFGPIFERSEITDLLNLSESDIDPTLPIEWVSTGLPYIIVPVTSLRAMRSIKINQTSCHDWLVRHKLYKTNSTSGLTTAFYPFCRETYSSANQLNARMFCLENDAIIEDAATGSASSCLLAYLLRNQSNMYSPVRLRLEQGYEINRKSLIRLDGTFNAADLYLLRIGGQVQAVAKGDWIV